MLRASYWRGSDPRLWTGISPGPCWLLIGQLALGGGLRRLPSRVANYITWGPLKGIPACICKSLTPQWTDLCQLCSVV